jgi:hypothetical protein
MLGFDILVKITNINPKALITLYPPVVLPLAIKPIRKTFIAKH